MAIAYTIIVADKAHQFVTTGTRATRSNHLTSGGIVVCCAAARARTLMLASVASGHPLSAMRVAS